jgi:hypothetical protein
MKTKMTNRDTELNRTLCILLAGLTEFEYDNIYIERACEYLNKVLVASSSEMDAYIQTPSFWKWWGIQWENREAALVTKYFHESVTLDDSQNVDFKTKWHMTHSITYLTNIHPNRFVMKATVNHFKPKV